MLNRIRDKLEEIDNNVFYGGALGLDKSEPWNYIVFGRKSLRSSANRTSYSDVYEVDIVREEYIPEGLDMDVIEKLTNDLPLKLNGDEFQYSYMTKGDGIVVEILALEFVKARRCC